MTGLVNTGGDFHGPCRLHAFKKFSHWIGLSVYSVFSFSFTLVTFILWLCAVYTPIPISFLWFGPRTCTFRYRIVV